jgi:ribosome-associated toxin RatA of RatAB toxin-antitoxin module
VIEIRRSAIVRHTPAQMFDLVNDVSTYPRRFAWCGAAQILAESATEITARLELRLGGLTQAFTTRNTLSRPERIELHLVDGPFRRLSGSWDFIALGDDGCKVELALDFEFSAGILAPLVRTGFQKLADRMVDEFSTEADRTYG